MKRFIHACFLAFICLYRSKYTGLRRSCTDHPRIVRGKDIHPSPGLKEYPKPVLTWLYLFLFGNLESKEPGCADNNRFRAVVFLGANHPKTLNHLLNLASFVLFIRCLIIKVFSFYKGLLTRSQSSAFKKVQSRKPYLRDASRGVCELSFGVPKKLMVMALLSLPLAGIAQESQERGAPVVIYGEIRSYDSPVTEVTVNFYPTLFHENNPAIKGHRYEVQTNEGNFFTNTQPGVDRLFELNIDVLEKPGYLDVFSGQYEFLKSFLVQPGDSILIRIDRPNSSITFGGPSAVRFKCQAELEQIRLQRELERPKIYNFQSIGQLDTNQQQMFDKSNDAFGRKAEVLLSMDDLIMSIEGQLAAMDDKEYLDVLDRYRNRIGETAFHTLKANYLSLDRYVIAKRLALAYTQITTSDSNPHLLQHLERLFTNHVRTFLDMELDNPYTKDAFQYIRLQVATVSASEIFLKKPFLSLVTDLVPPPTRDRVVAAYLLEKTVVRKEGSKVIRTALGMVEEPIVVQLLEGMYESQGTGKKALDFTLVDAHADSVSLADFEGKVVLVDYWFTGCGACVSLNKNHLTPLAEHFSDREDFAIVSISIDQKDELWRKGLSLGIYSPPTAIHLNIGTGRAGEDLLQTYNISSYPHVMLIDQKGNIVTAGYYRPTFEKLRDDINALF